MDEFYFLNPSISKLYREVETSQTNQSYLVELDLSLFAWAYLKHQVKKKNNSDVFKQKGMIGSYNWKVQQWRGFQA